MDELIKQVADYYNITPDDLMTSFNRRIVFIRSTLCDYLHNELQITNCFLAEYFKKDRNTIVKQTRDSEFERDQAKKVTFTDRAVTYELIKFAHKKALREGF